MATKEQTSSLLLDKLIGEVKTTHTSFNNKVQEAGLALISHASEFGDCSKAKILARAIPSRLRNSFIGWLSLYSPIGVSMGKTANDDKGRFMRDEAMAKFRKSSRVEGADKFPKFHIEGAKANPWYDDPARQDPEPRALDTLADFFDDMDSMLKRTMKALERENNPKFDPEQEAEIAAAVKELQVNLARIRGKHLKAASANEEPEKSAPANQRKAA